jgi:hypothetical protein
MAMLGSSIETISVYKSQAGNQVWANTLCTLRVHTCTLFDASQSAHAVHHRGAQAKLSSTACTATSMLSLSQLAMHCSDEPPGTISALKSKVLVFEVDDESHASVFQEMNCLVFHVKTHQRWS